MESTKKQGQNENSGTRENFLQIEHLLVRNGV